MVSGTDFSFTFDVLDQSTDGPSFFFTLCQGLVKSNENYSLIW